MRIWFNTYFKYNKMKRKAQEEIVGFVAIVVIVIVVLVIFLGVALRKDKSSTAQESKDIYRFLESMMQYTSSCAVSYEPAYSDLGLLIQQCHSGLYTCVSGEDPCKIAKETISKIIDSSFLISHDSSKKGYEFISLYVTNSTEEKIIEIFKGDCSQEILGSELLIPAFPGTISNSFKLCS